MSSCSSRKEQAISEIIQNYCIFCVLVLLTATCHNAQYFFFQLGISKLKMCKMVMFLVPEHITGRNIANEARV